MYILMTRFLVDMNLLEFYNTSTRISRIYNSIHDISVCIWAWGLVTLTVLGARTVLSRMIFDTTTVTAKITIIPIVM